MFDWNQCYVQRFTSTPVNTRVKSIVVDTKKELIDAAVQHAVAVHGYKDSRELREQIGKLIKAEA